MIRSSRKAAGALVRETMAAWAAIGLLVWVSIVLATTGCSSMKEQEQPLRVAHRGGAGLAPENTLAAFENGLHYHPDMVELDIHLSKDGELIVMHDPLLERTTGKLGQISDYDRATLATFDAAATYSPGHSFGFQAIPTLPQVFDLVETKAGYPIGYQIEIKLRSDGSRYAGIEKKLVALLAERGLADRSVVISFDFPTLETIGQLKPKLKRAALISKKYMTAIGAGGPKAVAADIASLGVDYVGINYSYLSQTLYTEFRNKNLGIGVWTVNEPSAMERMAAMGVDFITSDFPDILVKTLPIAR
ncbi:MAG: glycerophosphodiester phosphodiesterase [Sphaerochaetaceae bacterium]